MALRAVAGDVFLGLTNDGRNTATPPITFPGFDLAENFTWCMWVYPLGKRGDPSIAISDHRGTDGSTIVIGHNGFNWAYITRAASVAQETIYFNEVTYNRWALICFVKEGSTIRIHYGVEDAPSSSTPIAPGPVVTTTSKQEFDLYYFAARAGSNYYISNFKFWNAALDISNLVQQCNRFDTQTGGITGAVAPFWASSLRTPGDISSIANPYTGPNWAAGHAYSFISPPDNVFYGYDPVVLVNTPSPTWIYSIIPTASSSFNPGNSPTVPTLYDASQLWEMQDRGSLSNKDSDFISAEYYAYSHPVGSGYPASDSYGLYHNEAGTKVESNRTDPANRLEQDTGVIIPGGPTGYKISTMYAWKYGAQFQWQPQIPLGPTATQQVDYLHLLVTYQGYPTGVPHLPVDDLTGLFTIKKGTYVDQYNRGTQLKIPQPTIRTAYIGK